MMKSLIMVLFLSIAVVANAGLFITVDGVINPPDSTIVIVPSTWLKVGIWDDGQTVAGSLLSLGLSAGPGSLDASNVITQQGVTAVMTDNAAAAEALGLQNRFISVENGGSQPGILVSEINFHCDGPFEVTIALVDDDGEIVDTQVIHQVPEPMTLVLLGLGGLFLKRRIA